LYYFPPTVEVFSSFKTSSYPHSWQYFFYELGEPEKRAECFGLELLSFVSHSDAGLCISAMNNETEALPVSHGTQHKYYDLDIVHRLVLI
jgi:hypothetical protein